MKMGSIRGFLTRKWKRVPVWVALVALVIAVPTAVYAAIGGVTVGTNSASITSGGAFFALCATPTGTASNCTPAGIAPQTPPTNCPTGPTPTGASQSISIAWGPLQQGTTVVVFLCGYNEGTGVYTISETGQPPTGYGVISVVQNSNAVNAGNSLVVEIHWVVSGTAPVSTVPAFSFGI